MNNRLRVLLVPDSVHWVTGTIAKNIARFNPWIEATIASGPVIDQVFKKQPQLMQNFDLVHFVCPYASKQWLPRFSETVPCVTTHHHTTDWEPIKHNLDGDAIIVVSSEWAADLRRRGADMSRVIYIPNGVDTDNFVAGTNYKRTNVRRSLGIETQSIVIGFFGKNSSNDDGRKGIDIFIQAILGVNKRLNDLRVLIVGPGWQELVSCLNAAGVKTIWFPFIHDLEGLAEMYQALDFYWVTARTEGGPVTLLEAMSSEVCCLSTPVGIANDIVRDGHNAVLLPFDDVRAFVDRTASLASDLGERKRIGRNARITILEEIAVGVTCNRIVNVYAKAFERFAERRQRSAVIDVFELASNKLLVNPPDNKNVVPLKGFPLTLHGDVKMLESLEWAEHLILFHQQWKVALKMILEEWLGNPLSPLPARVLLRRLLPASIVERVVKLKKPFRTTAEFAAH